MMRILLIAPLEHPIGPPYPGGLEWHTAALANGLVARGHDVTLFARHGSVTRATLRRGQWYPDLISATDGFDVVHNNSLHYLPPLVIPNLVTTLHTPPYRRMRKSVRLTRGIGKKKFIAISDFIGKEWAPYCGEFRTIHNGIDPSAWSFGEQPQPNTAIWYGRIAPEKGLEYAIEACRKAKFKLKFAGPVTDRNYHEDKIQPLLGEDTEYLGHLEHSALAEEIGKASVGLFTSVWEEPFGLVLPEMLACGTPVAGFESGAAGELVDPSVARLVAKRDTDALSVAILEASKLDRSGCRAWAESLNSVSDMVEKYEAYYAE